MITGYYNEFHMKKIIYTLPGTNKTSQRELLSLGILRERIEWNLANPLLMSETDKVSAQMDGTKLTPKAPQGWMCTVPGNVNKKTRHILGTNMKGRG